MAKGVAALIVMVTLAGGSASAAPHWQRQPQMQRQPAGHAGQWLRQHQNLPPEQQRRALENDPQFRKLPPQRQEQLRERLDHFNSRPPEEKQRILNRMETWEHLTPAQKDSARQVHQQMQQLAPDRRQAVRSAIDTLRAMPPDARQRMIESDSYKSRFTPEERGILDGASKLPLAPAQTPP